LFWKFAFSSNGTIGLVLYKKVVVLVSVAGITLRSGEKPGGHKKILLRSALYFSRSVIANYGLEGLGLMTINGHIVRKSLFKVVTTIYSKNEYFFS